MPTRQGIEEQVRAIIVDELGVDDAEVTQSARLVDDLGADSLDITEMAIRFEEDLGVSEILSDDMEKLVTVKDVCEYIEKTLASAG